MSKVMRSVKNVTKGYSSTQVKVREATSNDPWGPTGTQMSEIAQMTFNTSTEFYDIMDMIDKRLNDKGKNWRHVLKALKVLDYCLHEGSELVVTWARQSIYIIKTLREFQYIDEDGRDVGQNVRVAAKEITSLILDEERLRAERSDRKTWKSRVTGLEENGPPPMGDPSSSSGGRRPRERRTGNEEDDAEYKLALEASKYQEEEDRKKRESKQTVDNDDDLAKAIKLSQEEDERRRKELEDNNAISLFDDEPAQPQPTGFNQGYQQGSQVDFFANPIEQNQMQMQPTGFMPNAYTGFPQTNQADFYNDQSQMQMQPTGYMQNAYTGFQQPQQTAYPQGYNPSFGIQPTGTTPYGQQAQQQQQMQQPSEPAAQAGSNNPWATNQQAQQKMQPMATGSNNPFAQFGRPQAATNSMSTLGSLPEQKTLSTFSQPQQITQQPQPAFGTQPSFTNPGFGQSQQLQNLPKKQMSEHESKLNSLLATGDGLDTYGNAGELRIPAQHTAPGTFMNSAGSGVQRVNVDQTGNNPYLRQQFTGMPNISYGGGQPGAQQTSNNPFGAQQQKPAQGHDLIQF